jgi:hypothetical protein
MAFKVKRKRLWRYPRGGIIIMRALGTHPMADAFDHDSNFLSAGDWLVFAFVIGALLWLAAAWGLFVMLVR